MTNAELQSEFLSCLTTGIALTPQASLSYVPLIAPSTSLGRIEFLASIADSFIYVVSKVCAEFSELFIRVHKAFHRVPDGYHGFIRNRHDEQCPSGLDLASPRLHRRPARGRLRSRNPCTLRPRRGRLRRGSRHLHADTAPGLGGRAGRAGRGRRRVCAQLDECELGWLHSRGVAHIEARVGKSCPTRRAEF